MASERPDADTGFTDATRDGDDRLVVVRLEPVTVEPSMDRATVIERLQRHARQTQPDVVSIVEQQDGLSVVSRFWLVNAVLVRVSPSADSGANDAIARLSNLDTVTRLHANVEVSRSVVDDRDATATPGENDTAGTTAGDASPAQMVSTTYGVEQVNAPAVWETYETRGAGTTVAVLDSGVDPAHPDIDLYTEDASDPTFPGGWAEFEGDGLQVPGSEPYDPHGLGTAVSGVVAGGAVSGQHIGVAPDARLIAGKIFDVTEDGSVTASFAQVLAGMEWAVSQEADVMAFGAIAGGFQSVFIEPVRNAHAAGTLVSAVVGGGGEGTSGSPANVYDALAVGATDENRDVRTPSAGQTVFTPLAWGTDAPADWPTLYVVPDLVAPGEAVLTASTDGGYSPWSGTALGNGFVAGVAALVESAADRDLTPNEAIAALNDTATKPPGAPVEQDTRYGHGIPDALAAADEVADRPSQERVAIGLTDATVSTDETGITFLETNASGVAGYQARITFDPDVIQIEGVSGEALPDPVVNIDNEAGVLFLTQSSTTGVDAPELASIEFSIVNDDFVETEIGFDREETLLNSETDDIPIDRFENATVRAESAPPVEGTTVSLSDVQVRPGETATTTLSATASNVAGYQARITFDPDAIQVETVAGADFPTPIANIDNEAGVLFVTQATATGQDHPDLARIELRAVGDSTTTTMMEFDRVRTRLNSPSGDIPIDRFEDATVDVGEPDCTPGDANRDGEVTPLDATLVSRFIVGLPIGGTFDEACADVSGDGGLSSIDVTLILRTVAGLPTAETAAPDGDRSNSTAIDGGLQPQTTPSTEGYP